MTIKQELIYYAKGCINGKIISCTKHKQACQRFLDDLERAKSKDCQMVQLSETLKGSFGRSADRIDNRSEI